MTLKSKSEAASPSGQQIEGAEGTPFDFSKPETIAAALEGVDRAYMLMPAGYLNAQELPLPFGQAAASRTVKVVFQNVIGVDADDTIPPATRSVPGSDTWAGEATSGPMSGLRTACRATTSRGSILLHPKPRGSRDLLPLRRVAAVYSP